MVWNIYYIGSKQEWIGTVEADDAEQARSKAALEFNKNKNKLLARRRAY